MCVIRHRYGPIGDFFMGNEDVPLTPDEIRRGARRILDGMRPVDPAELQPFIDERKRQLEVEPQIGLRPSLSSGWQCPNCGSAHAPDIATCPEPPRGSSLRERLKAVRS